MNDDKTEFIIFGSNRSLPKCNTFSIRVGDSHVTHAYCVGIFGMQMDEEQCQSQWKLPEINACPCKQGNATEKRSRFFIACVT